MFAESRWGAGISWTWAFNNERAGELLLLGFDPTLSHRRRSPAAAGAGRPGAYGRRERHRPRSVWLSAELGGHTRHGYSRSWTPIKRSGTILSEGESAVHLLAADATLPRHRTRVRHPEHGPSARRRISTSREDSGRAWRSICSTRSTRATGAAMTRDIPPAGQTNANFGKPGCSAPGRRLQIGLTYDFGPSIVGTGGR